MERRDCLKLNGAFFSASKYHASKRPKSLGVCSLLLVLTGAFGLAFNEVLQGQSTRYEFLVSNKLVILAVVLLYMLQKIGICIWFLLQIGTTLTSIALEKMVFCITKMLKTQSMYLYWYS